MTGSNTSAKVELYKDKVSAFCFPSLQILFIFFSFIFMTSHVPGLELTLVNPLFEITHELKQPSDVAVSKNGNIYVVDGVNNKIRIYDKTGSHLITFGSKGSGNSEFKNPLGICLGDSGNIYIADSGNHRIQVFSPEGSFISKFLIPTLSEKLSDPTDISVNEKNGKGYIVDNDNHQIVVYDFAANKILDRYGESGTGKRNFRYPFFITMGQKKYLYIVDVINTRIQVLNKDGLFVTFIGGWGVKKGKFFRPKGVTIDNNHRIYVSDSYLGVIQIFTQEGDFVSVIGDSSSRSVKKFDSPVGIFVDSGNRLYVVEMFANRVSVYQIEKS